MSVAVLQYVVIFTSFIDSVAVVQASLDSSPNAYGVQRVPLVAKCTCST